MRDASVSLGLPPAARAALLCAATRNRVRAKKRRNNLQPGPRAANRSRVYALILPCYT